MDMKKIDLSEKFSNVLKLPAWIDIQKAITDITGFSVSLYDSSCSVVMEPVIENRFQRLILDTERGRKIFENFLRKAIKMASGAKGPLILRSPVNQYCFIIPLYLVKSEPLFIVGGYCYLNYDDYSYFVENAQNFGLSPDQLTPLLARDVIFKSYEKVNAIARFVHITIQQILLKHSSPPQDHSVKGNNKQKAILELIAELARSPSYDEMYKQVFQTLCILFNVDSMSMMFQKGSYFVTTRAFGTIKESIKELRLNTNDSIIKKIIESQNPLFFETIPDVRKAGFGGNVISLYIFPFIMGEKTIGLIAIYNTRINEEDRETLFNFTQLLPYIWKYLSMKDEHVRMKRELVIFTDIYKTLGSIIDPDKLYDMILEKSTELIGAEQGSLMVLAPNAKELVGIAVRGVNKKLTEYLKVKVGEGIAGRVYEESTPLIVEDVEEDPRIEKKNRPRYKTKSFISIPLMIDNRTIGVLNITDKVTGEVFSEEDLRLLQSFASYASIALERLEFFKRSKDFKKIAITDHLTNLLNRRYFQERLTEEIERAKRHSHILSFMMIDIDNFKAFNDTRGHIAGDGALIIVARSIRNAVRTIDVVSRYGGEEFSVILPQTGKEKSRLIAERIKREVEQTALPHADMPPGRLTVSLGIASFPEDAANVTDLVNFADKALYMAKARGKNQICLYGR